MKIIFSHQNKAGANLFSAFTKYMYKNYFFSLMENDKRNSFEQVIRIDKRTFKNTSVVPPDHSAVCMALFCCNIWEVTNRILI